MEMINSKIKNMKYPVKFTYLGFILNSIIDNGGFIDLDIVKNEIENRTIFNYLRRSFGEELDVSLYTDEEIKEIEDYFYNLDNVADSRRKFGIEKNGICLLVAYCFNALQNNPEEL